MVTALICGHGRQIGNHKEYERGMVTLVVRAG